MAWRNKVNNTLRKYLEKQIADSIKERKAYEMASDPGNAQLWIAIANLSKEISELKSKIQFVDDFSKRAEGKLIGKKKEKK